MQRIFLTGLSGAGKTTVGKLVAHRLGWRFLDTDALIEDQTGRTVAQIFREEGEAAFRQRETESLQHAAAQEQVVVATGGGAVISAANRHLMRQQGTVVYLAASVESAWQRLQEHSSGGATCTTGTLAGAGHTSRPLLAGDNGQQKLHALYETRKGWYEEADLKISTDEATPEQVALQVIAGASVQGALLSSAFPAEQMRFDLDHFIVQASVEWGGLHHLPQVLQALGLARRVFLVTDSQVGALYAGHLLELLHQAGLEAHLCTVPAGENSKSLEYFSQVIDWLVQHKAERHDPLIALGGGVVGDLTGFVAASYQRGMPLIQVPTSLLAQVDAAIGGKTAINHPQGKNLIGAFYQPRLILADPACLLTLPERAYCEGWAEIIKSGVALDSELFAWLEASASSLLRPAPELLTKIVARCLRLKMELVQEDEREQGRRAILNYGHTIGHALEAVTGYTTWLHGEAVAIGMEAAAHIAIALGLLAPEAAARQRALLLACKLPISCPDLAFDALLEAMSRDKKVQSGRMRWVLPTSIGQAIVSSDVPLALVKQAVEAVCTERVEGEPERAAP
ncbi:MAG TPA: 3-dehydroquinate synthase [Ktedonobacterales bacterium]|jgi:3-dehydroquinate synthase